MIYPTRGHPVYKRPNIHSVAFSNQAIVVVDKLEDGLNFRNAFLKCIISVMSIHPEGPPGFGHQLGALGQSGAFHPVKIFSS